MERDEDKEGDDGGEGGQDDDDGGQGGQGDDDGGQGGQDEVEEDGVNVAEDESCEKKRRPEMKATRSKKPFYYMVLSHIKRSQLSNMYNSFKHQSKLSTINMLYYIIGSILRCLDQGGS